MSQEDSRYSDSLTGDELRPTNELSVANQYSLTEPISKVKLLTTPN